MKYRGDPFKTFDSVFLPVRGVDDESLVSILERTCLNHLAHGRKVLYLHVSWHEAREPGTEIVLHPDPFLRGKVAYRNVNRLEVSVKARDALRWAQSLSPTPESRRLLRSPEVTAVELLPKEDRR